MPDTLCRIRRRLASFHITPLGWIVLLLVPVAILLFIVGPHSVQVPALIAAALLLALVVAPSFSGGARGGSGGSGVTNLGAVQTAASEFQAKQRSGAIEEETDDPEAWRKERERRERAQRGEIPPI